MLKTYYELVAIIKLFSSPANIYLEAGKNHEKVKNHTDSRIRPYYWNHYLAYLLNWTPDWSRVDTFLKSVKPNMSRWVDIRVLTQPGNVAGEARFPNISRAHPFGHGLGSLAIALGCSTAVENSTWVSHWLFSSRNKYHLFPGALISSSRKPALSL